MGNRKFLLLASTNLQYLNALEFIQKEQPEYLEVILIKKQERASYNLSYLDNLIDKLHVFEIYHSNPLRRYLQTLWFFIITRYRFRKKKFDVICTGNFYEVLQNHVYQVVGGANKLVFLEDGVHTLKLPERIKREYFKSHWTYKVRLTYFIKFGFSPKELDVIPSFFTVFKLEESIQVIQNDYQFLKQKFSERKVNPLKVIVLGTLYKDPIHVNEYHEFMLELFKNNPEIHFQLCPHPSDKLDVMTKYSVPNCTLLSFDGGIEQYLLNTEDELPGKIYAFYSSALATLPILLKNVEFYNVRISTYKLTSDYTTFFDNGDFKFVDFEGASARTARLSMNES